ncbi:MAG: lamin tail domain-containing protein, partial [Lysobacterales bacterium]
MTLLLLMPAAAMAQDLVINETDADQVSTDAAEFVELYDGGIGGTSLDGLVLVFYNGSDDASYAAFDLDGQVTDGNGYFVLCGNAATVANCDMDVSPDTNLIQNGADAVALQTGNGTDFPEDTPVTTTGLIDAIVYDTDDGDDAGLLVLLNPGQPQVNERGGGDGTAHSNQRCPNGAGGVLNTDSYIQALPTPGAANNCGPAIPDVAINEIRGEQPGADDDEYFELAGEPGTSMDLLTYLVIGDGTGGSGVIEAVVSLGGESIPGGGYFVAAESSFTLGVADLTTTLNFEGSDNVTHLLVAGFTGANGDDLDTDDDGVLDVTPWDEVVDCIALVETVGSGDLLYCDDTVGPDGSFVPGHVYDCPAGWMIGPFDPAGGDDTPGAANDCPVPEGGLVINEIDYDQSGTDASEFIEIANTGDTPVDLTGHSLVLVNGSNDTPYKTIDLPAVSLAAGDYFVVCGIADNVYNCDLDVTPDTNLVQNGSPDAVALYFSDALLDTVSYEGDTGAPYTEGSGAGLQDSTADYTGISRFPDGSDTDVNNVDFSLRCITPGMANTDANTDCTNPAPPPLVINEIDYDQPGTDAAEFIEIHNAGDSPADLAGVELVLVNGSGAAPYLTIALPAVTLSPWDYFVVCGNAAEVANCDLDVSPDTNLIQNGSPDAVALQRGDEILDTVSYEGDTGGGYTEGSGSGLTDSSAEDYFGISRFPNGVDTNQNNVDLVGACITPGLANTSIASTCSPTAPTLEIFEIQGSGATSAYNMQGVTTLDNVVVAVGPSEFYMQTPPERADGSVDTSDGIRVYTGAAPAVAVGDRVDVTGMVHEYYELTTFSGTPTVTVISSGNPLPTPVVLGASVPSPDPAAPSCAIEYECYENMLVSVPNGVVTGGNQYFGSDPLAEVYITATGARTYREPGVEYPGLGGTIPTWDGNPEVFEMDPDKLGLASGPIYAGSTFSATGVIGYEYGGYELWPVELNVAHVPLPVPVRGRLPGETTVGSLNLFRLCDAGDDCPVRLAKFSM